MAEYCFNDMRLNAERGHAGRCAAANRATSTAQSFVLLGDKSSSSTRFILLKPLTGVRPVVVNRSPEAAAALR